MFTDDKRLFDAHRKASNIAGDWLENFAEVRKRKRREDGQRFDGRDHADLVVNIC